jgi:hypothetical protein
MQPKAHERVTVTFAREDRGFPVRSAHAEPGFCHTRVAAARACRRWCRGSIFGDESLVATRSRARKGGMTPVTGLLSLYAS